MSTTNSLLILGITGYIGGSVFVAFKEAFPDIKVTAIVRSPKVADTIQSLGVHVIVANSLDSGLIEKASSEADIVLNAADADDLDLTKAVLSGLKKRFQTIKGAMPILIHTSGTGVITDKAEGVFTEYAKKIWSDNSEEDIKSIAPDQPHRNVDLEIFKADEEGYVSAFIIAPSTIYGHGTGPVRKLSAQVPALIRLAVKRKQAVYVGEGSNVWNNVHIHDLVNLYVLVLHLALSGKASTSPYAKFFFGCVAEHIWGDLVKYMAPVLHSKGVVDTPEAASVTLAEQPDQQFTANNSRGASDRGFALGWKPIAPSILRTLEQDIETTLAEL